MVLHVGFAGFIAFLLASPVWLLMVGMFGFPTNYEQLIIYSLVHGTITLAIGILIVVFLKIQARGIYSA